MQKKQIYFAEKGITLVEVIIALVLLSSVIFAMVDMMITSTVNDQSNREYTVARQAVEDKLDEIKAKARVNFALVPTWYAAGGSPGNTFTVSELRSPSGTVAINSSNPSLYYVVVTLTWTGVRKITETVTLQTLINMP